MTSSQENTQMMEKFEHSLKTDMKVDEFFQQLYLLIEILQHEKYVYRSI